MPVAVAEPSTVDVIARAIADPTRRTIMERVSGDEWSAGDLAALFDMTRPAVSQHLRVLAQADLVTVRHEGTRRYYRARPEGLEALYAWVRQFWSDSLDQLKVEAETEYRRRVASTDATDDEELPGGS